MVRTLWCSTYDPTGVIPGAGWHKAAKHSDRLSVHTHRHNSSGERFIRCLYQPRRCSLEQRSEGYSTHPAVWSMWLTSYDPMLLIHARPGWELAITSDKKTWGLARTGMWTDQDPPAQWPTSGETAAANRNSLRQAVEADRQTFQSQKSQASGKSFIFFQRIFSNVWKESAGQGLHHFRRSAVCYLRPETCLNKWWVRMENRGKPDTDST